jgi:hypothetical protein
MPHASCLMKKMTNANAERIGNREPGTGKDEREVGSAGLS